MNGIAYIPILQTNLFDNHLYSESFSIRRQGKI